MPINPPTTDNNTDSSHEHADQLKLHSRPKPGERSALSRVPWRARGRDSRGSPCPISKRNRHACLQEQKDGSKFRDVVPPEIVNFVSKPAAITMFASGSVFKRTLVQRFDLGLKFRDRYARPQPRDHIHVVRVTTIRFSIIVAEAERRPELRLARKITKVRRHHADDRMWRRVDAQRATDHCRDLLQNAAAINRR